jgi:RimJ/RimL family protein N-acetyltransferase
MDTILCEIQNIPDVKKILTNVTVTQKSAQQLYKKLGFVEVGRLKDDLFFDGGYYDGLIMEKYL